MCENYNSKEYYFKMILGIIEMYLILILVIIHLSLIFCDETCLYSFPQIQEAIPSSILDILSKLFDCIPVNIRILQQIGQILLLGDIAFFIYLIASLLKALISKILSIAFLTVCIMALIYFLAFTM